MGVEETMVKNDPKVPTWMTWWEKCHFLGLVREQEKPTGWGREEGIGVGEGRLGELSGGNCLNPRRRNNY